MRLARARHVPPTLACPLLLRHEELALGDTNAMTIMTRAEPLAELAAIDELEPAPALSWADEGALLVDPDELLLSVDADDWPGPYGAARLGIP